VKNNNEGEGEGGGEREGNCDKLACFQGAYEA